MALPKAGDMLSQSRQGGTVISRVQPREGSALGCGFLKSLDYSAYSDYSDYSLEHLGPGSPEEVRQASGRGLLSNTPLSQPPNGLTT